MADLTLTAPIRGWAAPLDEVDDPVFAARMLGDGVAIDPTGSELRAPCDGHVIGIHAAGHAATLRAANGAEILLHVGLETVSLGGAGFTRHVAAGQSVRRGDLLISVDLDFVAAAAKSLITPMVITNGDEFVIVSRVIDRHVEVGDVLAVIRGVASSAAVAAVESAPEQRASRRVIVPLAHGLHARPAALVAAEAKRHRASIQLAVDGRTANAKSPVAIMSLGLAHGASVEIVASGPDAEVAVSALADLIAHRLPSEAAPAPSTAPAAAPVASLCVPGVLQGTAAAPGLAIGVATRLTHRDVPVRAESAGVDAETLALAAALDALRARTRARARTGPRQQREILLAHLAFLDDEDLIAAADAGIGGGLSAGMAWRAAVGNQIEALRAVRDPLIAQRADDLVDLERQVQAELAGDGEERRSLPAGAILLAHDLGPGELMSLEGGPSAICTVAGGPTSHVAILASAMNIPAVVALGPALMDVADGAEVIVDGVNGVVRIAPDAAETQTARARLAALDANAARSRAEAAPPCRMADGTRIEVFANIGSLADARAAAASGAEGCGLLRTEFLFLERTEPPDEDEQALCYQAIADALAGPLIIRTLDIGGDKPAPFLGLPTEDNPALGLRGVRVSLWRPELLAAQIRAILRVRPQGRCRILVPMVASLAELSAVRAMVEAVRDQADDQGPALLGVMIETPAAAVTADILAAEADFLSIGTNDLTQYALAMDRGNPAVASGVDAMHPAVLRLIALSAKGARAHGRPLAVCGGLAAEPAGAALLIGLGVSELSAPPAAIPQIKAAVRKLTVAGCEALATRARDCADAASVRGLISEFLGETP